MNKRIIIVSIAFFAVAGMCAQTSGIESILREIEKNNKELQADRQFTLSQKLENKSGNNLSDPALSYSHLWDSDNSNNTVGELIISQSFDFPTLYTSRNRVNHLKANALDARTNATRQQILLQAKEICLDIILLQRQQQLLNQRLKNAEELAVLYSKRLDTGDANILETNKINLELLNVRTEVRMNRTTLESKMKTLLLLNGSQPLTIGSLPAIEVLKQTDYPILPIPANFQQVCNELLNADPNIQSYGNESAAAHKQIAVSKQGWLPKLELGYRRNTENGHPLNGVLVGFSLPIFQNRNKVRIAKARAAQMDFQKENIFLRTQADLWQLYEEAQNLYASIDEYRQTLSRQQDLSLLKQALAGGQISMIEYFVEIAVVYQSQDNLLQLENQYQKAMAKIYKSKL